MIETIRTEKEVIKVASSIREIIVKSALLSLHAYHMRKIDFAENEINSEEENLKE